jgi:HSP20 family protein
MSQVASERERKPASRQQTASGQEVVSGQQAHWASLEQVPERMRRMLEQTLGSFGSPALLSEAAAWTPLVDIEEEDDAFVIEAELPGVKRDDVNIELVGNELSITGEIKERERKGVVRRRTRRVGRFDYRVALPSQVDTKKIEAKLNEGVLTVRVPKAERAQRQRIEVKAS